MIAQLRQGSRVVLGKVDVGEPDPDQKRADEPTRRDVVVHNQYRQAPKIAHALTLQSLLSRDLCLVMH
jgi:hypothetical protein